MKYGTKLLTRSRHWFERLSYGGLAFGTAFFCFSLMPSLLPRPWLFQGFVSGVSLAIGYGAGTGLSSIIRWLTESELPSSIKRNAWRALAIAAPGFVLVYLYLGRMWQNELRQLVGESGVTSRHSILTFFFSLTIATLLLSAARGIRLFSRWLQRTLDKWLPRRVSNAFTGAIVIVLFIWVVSGVFTNFLVSQANRIFSSRNTTTAADAHQPTTSSRSGGPDSLTGWDTLGYQGRSFVGRGPSAAQIARFTGADAQEPIRVYSGLESAPDAESRAQLAVRELQRTGAFDRQVLVIANTTGTGWLEPQAIDSVEYMWGGDTAIVSQQYSYLPSWISFLVDKENATDAGLALFDAVYGEWVKLPVDQRPQLYAYGLSLGSFGGQAAYSGVNGLRNTLDGALFVGTPNDTRLWGTVTKARDTGSPEWQPLYQDGAAVRFASTNADIAANQESWQGPRLLYVQHGSDPIVWFSFDLIFNRPDWLAEARAPDVSSAVQWYPIVTFWQVTIDQIFGVNVPAGHGHNYTNTAVSSWAAITEPADWTEQDSQRLQSLIDAYPVE